MAARKLARHGVVVICGLLAALVAGCSTSRPTGPAGEKTVVEPEGARRMYYKGPELEATLDFDWADRHLGDQWLIIKLSMAGIGPSTRVDGSAIRVVTPDGHRLPLMDQRQFLKVYPTLRVTLDAAQAWVGPTGRFAGSLIPCGFWYIVPMGVSDFAPSLEVTPLRVCYGPLVFQVPNGVQPGRWLLEIDLRESHVRIPFELGQRR